MYIRTYRCRSRHYSAWFEDDGKLLHVMQLESLGKGLFGECSMASETQFEKKRSEWEEIPYKPCLVALPINEHYKELWLKWGAYNENELSSSRTRKKIIPLDGLMDFLLEFLDSHEGYDMNIAFTCIVHGGATHHMTPVTAIRGIPYEELVETIRRYLSEVL